MQVNRQTGTHAYHNILHWEFSCRKLNFPLEQINSHYQNCTKLFICLNILDLHWSYMFVDDTYLLCLLWITENVIIAL